MLYFVMLTGFNCYPKIVKWGGVVPVILYGIFISWLLEVEQWIRNRFGH